MLYTYDRQNLIHRKIGFKPTVILLSGLGLIAAASYYYGITCGFSRMSDVERAVIIQRHDEFHKDKLSQMLKDLNVKFPHIVMAQSIQETGHWKSSIFLENNNLFGMKEARSRITTAGGTSRNHAFYGHWRESVYDYAFYQCRYLAGIRSEAEYYQYISASYAEDPAYVQRVKAIVEREGLKKMFWYIKYEVR